MSALKIILEVFDLEILRKIIYFFKNLTWKSFLKLSHLLDMGERLAYHTPLSEHIVHNENECNFGVALWCFLFAHESNASGAPYTRRITDTSVSQSYRSQISNERAQRNTTQEKKKESSSSIVPKTNKAPVCDKCDGKHETSVSFSLNILILVLRSVHTTKRKGIAFLFFFLGAIWEKNTEFFSISLEGYQLYQQVFIYPSKEIEKNSVSFSNFWCTTQCIFSHYFIKTVNKLKIFIS